MAVEWPLSGHRMAAVPGYLPSFVPTFSEMLSANPATILTTFVFDGPPPPSPPISMLMVRSLVGLDFCWSLALCVHWVPTLISGERGLEKSKSTWSNPVRFFLGNMKVLDILLSSRGVDGRGGLPARQSSLVLRGIRCEVGGAKGKS